MFLCRKVYCLPCSRWQTYSCQIHVLKVLIKGQSNMIQIKQIIKKLEHVNENILPFYLWNLIMKYRRTKFRSSWHNLWLHDNILYITHKEFLFHTLSVTMDKQHKTIFHLGYKFLFFSYSISIIVYHIPW